MCDHKREWEFKYLRDEKTIKMAKANGYNDDSSQPRSTFTCIRRLKPCLICNKEKE